MSFDPVKTYGIMEEVVSERIRQVGDESWTTEHHDEHADESMALAAALYALPSEKLLTIATPAAPGWRAETILNRLWPWDFKWWKPKNRRYDLIRAAALIVAEIERLDRIKE